MYVHTLYIENLRCFSATQIQFQYPGREKQRVRHPNINLLLGNNGTGKTTVLKGIALALLSPIIEGAGYVPYHLIRHHATAALISAEVIVHQQDTSQASANSSAVEQVETRVESRGSLEMLRSTTKTSPLVKSGLEVRANPE